MHRTLKTPALLCAVMCLLVIGMTVWAQLPTQPINTYVRVVYPNGGETLKVGSTYRVSWNASSQIKNVGIMLVNNQRSLLYPIISSTANTGAYLWSVPTGVVAADGYQVKIYDVGRPAIVDLSDRYFTIQPASQQASQYAAPGWRPETEVIQITSPRASEKWYKKDYYYIRWDKYPSETEYVNIFVSPNDGSTYSRIELKVRARDKRYRWKVPKDFYSSPNYRIKITDAVNQYYYGVSGRFVILDRDETIDTEGTPSITPTPTQPTPTPRPVRTPARTPTTAPPRRTPVMPR